MITNKKLYFFVCLSLFSIAALFTSCKQMESLVSCMSPKDTDSKDKKPDPEKKSQQTLKKERGFLATWNNATELFYID